MVVSTQYHEGREGSMRIREVLDQKGSEVVTVEPDCTVHEAMKVLVEHNIGAVVVTRDRAIVGILTERDVLRLGATGPEFLSSTRVADAMTSMARNGSTSRVWRIEVTMALSWNRR